MRASKKAPWGAPSFSDGKRSTIKAFSEEILIQKNLPTALLRRSRVVYLQSFS